jgi:NAD(P) transhydrogenase subunit alpha
LKLRRADRWSNGDGLNYPRWEGRVEMIRRIMIGMSLGLLVAAVAAQQQPDLPSATPVGSARAADNAPHPLPAEEMPAAGSAAEAAGGHARSVDYFPLLFVFLLATFIGLGVVARVSRLLHTPLMSLTNAISGIAVVGSTIVAGGDYPPAIRLMGAVALFASMTNVVSGFLITDRMLKMFRQSRSEAKR